jgi:pyruvate,water dikinase
MAITRFIRWFRDITMADVGVAGGKNASLGEMCRELIPRGISVPNGFAITAEGYRHVLQVGGLAQTIQSILSDLNTADLTNLAERGCHCFQFVISPLSWQSILQTIGQAAVMKESE